MAKKKKMTKAQAAAARRDDGRQKRDYSAPVDTSGPRDSTTRLIIAITVISLLVVAVLSAVYAIPGLLGQ